MINKKLLRGITCLMMILLMGCSSQAEKDALKERIVTFTLQSIIKVDKLEGKNLIIYGPTITNDDFMSVDREAPYHLWVKDGELIDKGNSITAITDFYQIPDNNDKQLFEFGIVSINTWKNEAKVYVGMYCGGPVCGAGVMYTIRLNQSGQWEIEAQEALWVS